MTSQNNYYLVQSYGGNFTLHDFTKKAHLMIEAGQLSTKEWRKAVRVIFRQMVEAVEFLHKHRTVHFDISLENFLISDAEVTIRDVGHQSQITFKEHTLKVKLCDFGLSQVFDTDSDFHSHNFVGKPAYFSPEIANRDAHGFNAKSNDIWCLGVCLFMLSVGGHPFQSSLKSDPAFQLIVDDADGVKKLLQRWKMIHYVSAELIDLIQATLRYEANRIDLDGMKESAWLKATK